MYWPAGIHDALSSCSLLLANRFLRRVAADVLALLYSINRFGRSVRVDEKSEKVFLIRQIFARKGFAKRAQLPDRAGYR
jgi:hypothetical protein